MGFRPAQTDSVSKVLADAVGYEELGVFRPAIGALGEADLVVAQGLAMGRGGVDLVRRAIADVAIQDKEGRAARRLAKHLQGLLDSINVVRVADPQNVPTVTQESGRDVLREGDSRIPFDGDVVIVVNPAEIVQAKMARQ